MQLMLEHMSMLDVKRYMLGVLTRYSELQRFKPEKHPLAKCYNGQQLLSLFKFLPDMQVIAGAYPWLTELQQQC